MGAGFFSGTGRPVEEEEEQHTDRDSRIGDVEHGPSRELIPENVDIEEIHVEKINDLAVKHGRIAEYDAVKDTVDQVAERAPQYHREREPETQRFPPCVIEIRDDGHAGGDGKKGEEQLPPYVDPECHPGIFYVGEAEEIPQKRPAGSVRYAPQQDPE